MSKLIDLILRNYFKKLNLDIKKKFGYYKIEFQIRKLSLLKIITFIHHYFLFQINIHTKI